MNIAIAPDALDWTTIWHDYNRRIYAFIRVRVRKYGSTDELAEDLTMEVFEKAIAAGNRGKGPHSCLTAWLFQIARYLVIDHYRANRRIMPAVSLDAIAFEDTDEVGTRSQGEIATANELTPHELAEQAITRQRVWSAVGNLRGDQAHVIARRLGGYEFDEIATEIGKSHGATKALQHRAYVNLQISLQEQV